VRLRFLAEHLHSLGARALHGFIEMMLAGEMPDGLAVMDVLERHTGFDANFLRMIDGY
jgi:hypothetical protein